MRRQRRDEGLREFVAARTQDLHHDAYVLTASQSGSEQLVAIALADLSREHVDLTRAATTARQRMARVAARVGSPTLAPSETSPARFRPLAALTPRQRALWLLELVDAYDRPEAARALRLKPRDVEQAYAAIPLALADADPAELRCLLDDFGDLAEAPDPATTLAAIRAVPPPPRRPRWTYAAATLVVALTMSAVSVAQTWHEEWLRSAAGLNDTHGTHFPEYTQGYKLVGIHEISAGPESRPFPVPPGDTAVLVDCNVAGVPIAISSDYTGTYFQADCPHASSTPDLTPVSGMTSITTYDRARTQWAVAIYQQVPWNEYPVATRKFVIQPKSLDTIRRRIDDSGHTVDPVSGTVLTMRGSAASPNGTFVGRLSLPEPDARRNGELAVIGVLSPTTSGRYLVRINHQEPWVDCASINMRRNTNDVPESWCALYDQLIPAIEFSAIDPVGVRATTRSLDVEVVVENALGPWSMQVVADRYAEQ